MFSPKTLDTARATLSGIAAAISMILVASVKADAATPNHILLKNEVNAEALSAQSLGPTSASQQINLGIALHLRNENELDRQLKDLYDPTSPNYHQFLSNNDFNSNFAPTQAQYNAVIEFAQKHGLKVTGTYANRLVVDVSGTAASVESALSVHFNDHQMADGRKCYASDVNPSIPSDIAGSIAAIVGLDNVNLFQPHLLGLTDLGLSKIVNHAGSGTNGLLVPADIKKAYGLSSVTQDGTGQTLAVFELDGYAATDVQKYETQYGLPNVPLTNVMVDGYSGSPGTDGGNVEVTLDIELMAALAPKASSIIVYEAPNSWNAVVDEYTKIAADNLAKSISTSWGLNEICTKEYSNTTAEQAAFKEMASQGQTIYAAAGDSGAYDGLNEICVDDPASQPYMCGVGGTTLTTTSAQAYSSETTWGSVAGTSSGGGGGVSIEWPKPGYQAGLGLTSNAREVPDVSLNADPNTGYLIYVNGGWYGYGGTSCAAPLWAAFTALVNQARVAKNLSTLGFVNPAIYALGQTGAYYTDFHDIQNNSTNRFYPAIPGYDDATGWGTFNGANLLRDLSSGTALTPTAPSAPTNLVSKVGTASTVLTWSASTGATYYNVLSGSSAAGPFFLIGTSTTPTYTDSTAKGTALCYVVQAASLNGLSGFSAAAGTGNISTIAPTGMTANSFGIGNCNTQCNAVQGATSYIVGMSLKSGGPYTQIANPPTNATTIQGLQPATTYYFVMAGMVGGQQTGWSNEASGTTIIYTPGNLKAVASPDGSTKIILTWTTNTGDTGYSIKRGASGQGPFTQIATTTALTYTDSNITAGQGYWYVVDGTNGNVTSYDGTAMWGSAGATAPKTLVANLASGGVSLVCGTVQGATSYNFYRGSTSGGPYTLLGSSANNGYTDKTGQAGLTYYYVAQTVNGPSKSSYSPQASCLLLPAAPTALSGTASAAGVQLKWTAPAGTGLSYEVLSSWSAATVTNYSIGNATTPSFMDTGVGRGVTQYYCVVARNSAGNSPNSAVISVVTFPAAPSSPAGISAKLSGSSVVVSWTTQTAATSYTVYRGTAPNYTYTSIGTSSTGTYTDSTVAPGNEYIYYVTATGSGGTSSHSNATPGITVPILAPTNITASSPSSSSIKVMWTAVPNAVSYYVEYGTKSGGPYQGGITGCSTTTSSTTFTNLAPSTTYYFVVSTCGVSANSAYSSQVSATTQLQAPSGLGAQATGPSTVTLQWNASNGATGYILYRSTSATTGFTAIKTLTATSYTDSGLLPKTLYYYYLVATAGSQTSVPSSTASTTTQSLLTPSSLSASAVNTTSINLTWSDANPGVTYTVYQSASASSGFKSIGTSSATSFSNTGLTKSTTYYYYVIASLASVSSSASSTVNGTTTSK